MPELSPENWDIWRLYQTINTQFVYDFHALPLVFNVWALKMTHEEAKMLLDKLTMIHGILSQKKEKQHGGDE